MQHFIPVHTNVLFLSLKFSLSTDINFFHSLCEISESKKKLKLLESKNFAEPFLYIMQSIFPCGRTVLPTTVKGLSFVIPVYVPRISSFLVLLWFLFQSGMDIEMRTYDASINGPQRVQDEYITYLFNFDLSRRNI